MPRAQLALWRTVRKIDKSKINSPWIGLRNALGVGLPLAIGIAIGNPLGGVAVATGALNVSFADGADPYAQRARRMLLWSGLGAVAVFVGSVTGRFHWAAILVAAAWAFVGGLCIAISTKGGDLGLNTLVTVVVFAARGAMSPLGALYAALLVLGGGFIQTGFALLFWAIRRYEPERRAVGNVFLNLAKEVDPDKSASALSPLEAPSSQVQEVLSALGQDHSVEGERFRLLFDQADRLRMSIFVLERLRTDRDGNRSEEAEQYIGEVLRLSSKVLSVVGGCLLADECVEDQPVVMNRLKELTSTARQLQDPSRTASVKEVGLATDALAGQLRLAAQLANNSTPAGLEAFGKSQRAQPGKLQMAGRINILRANLNWKSAACRHAVRLAVCVAIADAIGRSISWERSYWLPMTTAVILKPDFTSTISRGLLRLGGTFAGLILATVLFHLLPPSALTQLFLVGIFTYFLRYLGPANYGIFSAAVGGLIVFLIAETGISPADVVVQRALNTAAGGLFALLAYSVWPTWERTQVSESLAEMLDACRHYFHAVVLRYETEDESVLTELDRERDEWRRTRTNAEASVDRVSSEPGITATRLDLLTSMLASSHALALAVTELEAGIAKHPAQRSPAAFRNFANDVEFTLYFVSAALRGSPGAVSTLPILREDHTRLVEARDEFTSQDDFVILETDRLTVSLNTLREQVMRFVE